MSLKSTNKIETNRYEILADATAEQFEAAIEKAYRKQRNKINVPGFRKGKATRKMIEKLYGEGCFYDEAVNDMVPEICGAAVEEAALELVDRPEIEVVSLSREDGVSFKVTVTTKPEVEISDYKGIEVEKSVKTVTDEDVDSSLGKIRERNGRLVTVDDRAVENGDTVDIDFEGFIDGVAFEGGKEDHYSLKIGSGQFIPGFEDQIVGKTTGEEFTINVVFPENYQMETVAGKPAEFRIKLHEIQTTELPELDDDLAKDVSEFDTLDELKADIRKKLEDAAVKSAETEVENKLYDAVIEKMTAEIPQCMINAKIDELVYDFQMRLSQQGLDLDMYLSFTGGTKESFRESFKEQAEKTVKARLALEKIAKLENIEVSEERVEEEYGSLAEKYKLDKDSVKRAVPVDGLKADLIVSEAFKLVKDSAKISE